jgi:hypothetical protein
LYRPEELSRSEERIYSVIGQCAGILKNIEHVVETIGERLDQRSATASQYVAESEAGPPDGDFTSDEDISHSDREQASSDETKSATGEPEYLEETTTGELTSNKDLESAQETTSGETTSIDDIADATDADDT